MKSIYVTLLLVLAVTAGFSGNYEFHYSGSSNPKVSSEKLNNVNSLNDLAPDFWQYALLKNDDRQELNFLKKTDFTNIFSVVPKEYDYNNIIEIISVEIRNSDNGNIISAKSESENLTLAQKQLLKNADPGTDINVKVNFRFKNHSKQNIKSEKIKTGSLTVNVFPGTEAVYPGGFNQLSDYYTKNVFSKISDDANYNKIMLASVKFTINEEGQVTDAYLTQSTTDSLLDKLIIEQTKKMPQWSPAKNSDGIKIKQEINIPFGGYGC